jgi:crotonobetainyl-CoA:carnitine CoA-transferase CaiB-like acyl-CoA transferase
MRVVTIALNIPGPVAAARLRELGATVTKVEPPDGDPLALAAPDWYGKLVAGQEVVRLDLKREPLDWHLHEADLLLTSQRVSALARLGLAWGALHERHPRLSQVAIVGEGERAGHDLTYLAGRGLLDPPRLPRTVMADLMGAERAVSAALALQLARERGAGPSCVEVSLAECADALAAPLRAGLTSPSGILGGGFPGYGVYEASDGWVAVAALEPGFRERLAAGLGADELTRPALEAAFRSRTAAAWEEWALEHDVPIEAIRS